MVRSNVNGKYDFIIENTKDQLRINGEPYDFDFQKIDDSTFHFIYKNRPFKVRILNYDIDLNRLDIRVNQHRYSVLLQDEGDMLLQKIGISRVLNNHADILRAPMPGLILDIRVVEGQQVMMGEPLIVLKAMKMENILKSPHDGVIKRIEVEKNQKIEKDSVLIQF
jgi:acetyl/propionyl-CoA carboxylase alpha subunit